MPDLDLGRTGDILFAERASAAITSVAPTPSGFNTPTTSERTARSVFSMDMPCTFDDTFTSFRERILFDGFDSIEKKSQWTGYRRR
jgi:hypothetical protein